MERTNLFSDIHIPKNLGKWVVGYQNVDTYEYDFYLKNFPLTKIRIKASRVKLTQKYFAEPNFKLKFSGSHNRFSVPHGVSEDPIQAIYICLENLIHKGPRSSFTPNTAYSGKPFIR